MLKEDKEANPENSHQDDTLSHSEFGFVYEFFISEQESSSIEKTTARERHQERNESELKFGDQSAIFFLPDCFTDET